MITIKIQQTEWEKQDECSAAQRSAMVAFINAVRLVEDGSDDILSAKGSINYKPYIALYKVVLDAIVTMQKNEEPNELHLIAVKALFTTLIIHAEFRSYIQDKDIFDSSSLLCCLYYL